MKNSESKYIPRLLPFKTGISRFPFWLSAAVIVGVVFLWKITADQDYSVIFRATSRGLGTTVYVSLISYFFATLAGLILGLMRVSVLRPLRELSSFIVEIVRGIPMLVILYYIAFVGAPGLVELINLIGTPLIKAGMVQPLSVRDLNFVTRAIIALALGYSAFISEIFRAGIESVDNGQAEAGLALGLSRWQTMTRIILPQAVRNVLPPLGNEFVAMIKDSALVSALGVQDVTQLGKVYSASTFRFFETYNIVAFLYLTLTLTLSLLIRLLERYLDKHRL